jgi:hypothetical protein
MSGDPKRVDRGGGMPRAEAATQIREHLNGHSRAHTAGVDEFAVLCVVAEQQRTRWGRDPSGSDQPTMTNSCRFSALAFRQRPRFPGA